MNLEESQQEVDRQIEEQGVVTLDSKTVPAIENLIRNALNAQEAKEAANPEPPYSDGVEPDSLGGNCPVQGDGRFTAPNGEQAAYYFRARGSRWTVEVGEKAEPHVYEGPNNIVWEIGFIYSDCETHPYAAGWMTRAEAIQRINLAYEIWLKQGAMQARGQYLGNEHD